MSIKVTLRGNTPSFTTLLFNIAAWLRTSPTETTFYDLFKAADAFYDRVAPLVL